MPLFLIIFLSLYGGMHAYIFYLLKAAFSPGRSVTILLSLFFGAMIFAPLLVRLSERAGMDLCALCIAWPGYIWMGFAFILLAALVAMEVLRGVCGLLHRFLAIRSPVLLPRRIGCVAALLAAISAGGYSFYEALSIRREEVMIASPKLPPGTPNIRIVQISDVHIGLLFREERLERVLKVVREARPDVIVSTGDLVDGKLNLENIKLHQDRLAAMLASVPAPAGKFAVTGNHEFYAGLREALDFTKAAGFTLLREQSIALPNGMTISGVDDQVILGGERLARDAEKKLLGGVPKNSFNVFLKHRPETRDATDVRFDLQLSGHAHKGQIFPFNLLVKLKYPLPSGTSGAGSGSIVHVSRGSGTWGPPMRLLAPPEVTVIDIVPAGGKS